MIGFLRTRVRKQPIIALYFEFETVFKFYNLEPRRLISRNIFAIFCKLFIVTSIGWICADHQLVDSLLKMHYYNESMIMFVFNVLMPIETLMS